MNYSNALINSLFSQISSAYCWVQLQKKELNIVKTNNLFKDTFLKDEPNLELQLKYKLKDEKEIDNIIQKIHEQKKKIDVTNNFWDGKIECEYFEAENLIGLKFIENENLENLKSIGNEFLEETQRVSHIGSWKYDYVTQKAIWSSTLYEILDADESFVPSYEGILKNNVRRKYQKTAHQNILEAVKKGQKFDFEIEIKTNKGIEKWMRVIGKPTYKNNKTQSIIGILQDITDLKTAKEKYKTQNKFINTTFELLPIGVALIKKSTRETLYFNKKFEEILNYNITEIQSLDEFYNKCFKDQKYLTEILTDVKKQFEAGHEVVQLENIKVSSKNAEKRLNMSAILIDDIDTYVFTIYDVTSNYKAKKELDKINERFYYAAKSSSDAIWETDLINDKYMWSDSFKDFFYIEDDLDNLTIESWKKLVHPNDIDRVVESFDKVLENPNSKSWQEYYRVKKTKTTYADVRANAYIVRDQANIPIKLIGTLKDITLEKQREKDLKIYKNIIENIDQAVMISNPKNDKLIYVNDAFYKSTQIEYDNVIGENPGFLLSQKNNEETLDRIKNAIKKQKN